MNISIGPEDHAEIQRFASTYNPETGLAGTPRTSAQYAALLCRRGESDDIARAENIVKKLISLQINAPEKRIHGQFPMLAEGTVGDLNAALFMMPSLILILKYGLDKMSPETRSRFDACVRCAITATERRWHEERFDLHRDFKAYTNIFLLYIQSLLLAGNYYRKTRLQRQATAQWQRWFNHIAYYGIDEFVSPTYGNVDYNALKTIHEQSGDRQVRRESGYVLEHLSAQMHAVTHPVLKLPVCGSSRNYRRFLTRENCEPACVQEGLNSPYTLPVVRAEYQNRNFPCVISGRATPVPFRYQSWQDRHVAMGTMTGGNYFWQQIHCMIAAGNSEKEREVVFAPGAYTPTSGFACQKEHAALCVFTRQPNTYHRTQIPMPDDKIHAFQHGFGIGFTSGWKVRSENRHDIVLSAYEYDVHIRPFEIVGGKVQAVVLDRVKQNNVGQERFHPAPADFDELRFPAKAVRFGFVISVCAAGTAPNAFSITSTEQDEILTIQTGHGLNIRLFQQPSGEVTELYDRDWRTLPIFASRTQTLYPGELCRLAARNDCPASTMKHNHSSTNQAMIVAHRGASGDAPENTIPAFNLAWHQGADAVEGDFHQTKDGYVVCIHDQNTARVAGNNLLVRDSLLEELRALDVGSYRADKYRGDTMSGPWMMLRLANVSRNGAPGLSRPIFPLT